MKTNLFFLKTKILFSLFLSFILLTSNAQELPKVAIIACDYYGAVGELQLQSELEATGRFQSVGFWNAITETQDGTLGSQPSLQDLMEYDAVLLSPNGNLIDPVALGNDMYAFAYEGKGVILTAYSLDDSSPYFMGWLQGSWENGNWDIVIPHEFDFMFGDCHLGIGTIYEPDSPLVQDIETLTFPMYGPVFPANPPVVSGAIKVLDMEMGAPLLFRHDDLPNRIDIGYLSAIAADCSSNGYLTGGANFIANCFEYVSDITTAIDDIPLQTKAPILSQNQPNPFKETTWISYDLPKDIDVRVKLSVFNMHGVEVAILVDALQSGAQTTAFEAGDLPKGVYFYTLETGEITESRKLVID